MNNAQLKHITHIAQFALNKCADGHQEQAIMFMDRLHGWWDCAMSCGDFDLAQAAYRGATAIEVATSSISLVISDNKRRLMWGDES